MSDSLFINRDRAKQLIEFKGVMEGSCSPTDIDGLIEYHNKAFIFIEVKGAGKDLPLGQSLALERLCDSLNQVKPTLVIVADHNTQNPNDDIPLKDTTVRKFRWQNKWRFTPEPTTVKEMVSTFTYLVDNPQITD